MSEISNRAHEHLSNLFIAAVEKIQSGEVIVTDIYVNIKSDDLSLSISDDMGNVLVQDTIDEWSGMKEEDSDGFDAAAAESLRITLQDANLRQMFEKLCEDTCAPISIILVDDDNETIEELATFDKDLVVLDDSFFDKIDKELDDFFEKLMADVK